MNKTVLLAGFLLTCFCIQAQTTLVTDSSFAGINKKMQYADLQKLFGKANVKDAYDYGPEGDSVQVTKIYAETAKELIVQWEENKFHKKITYIESYQDGSPYKTADGLGCNIGLKKLLAVNGKPIKFYGFGWDYGGLIVGWGKGKFEKSNIRFKLNGKESLGNHLMGDGEFNTGMAIVKKYAGSVYISSISVGF